VELSKAPGRRGDLRVVISGDEQFWADPGTEMKGWKGREETRLGRQILR
jgi:hypothetical protein